MLPAEREATRELSWQRTSVASDQRPDASTANDSPDAYRSIRPQWLVRAACGLGVLIWLVAALVHRLISRQAHLRAVVSECVHYRTAKPSRPPTYAHVASDRSAHSNEHCDLLHGMPHLHIYTTSGQLRTFNSCLRLLASFFAQLVCLRLSSPSSWSAFSVLSHTVERNIFCAQTGPRNPPRWIDGAQTRLQRSVGLLTLQQRVMAPPPI